MTFDRIKNIPPGTQYIPKDHGFSTGPASYLLALTTPEHLGYHLMLIFRHLNCTPEQCKRWNTERCSSHAHTDTWDQVICGFLRLRKVLQVTRSTNLTNFHRNCRSPSCTSNMAQRDPVVSTMPPTLLPDIQVEWDTSVQSADVHV